MFMLRLLMVICESRVAGGGAGKGYPQSPFGIGVGAFTSPEDLMKNLPKAMSNMFGGGGAQEWHLILRPLNSIMIKYEDIRLKVGDKVTVEIKKADSSGI